jgi:hypothetical protein
VPVVRRALHVEHGVRDAEAAARKLFLELRLVVDVARERVVDLLRERVEDGLADRLEAVLEVERAERGLDERREDVAVDREPLELLRGNRVSPALDERRTEPEPAADDRAALPRDDVRPDLRELAFGVVGKTFVELPRDREPEDGVAEELEALVRVRPRGGPGRVGEDMRRPRFGQRVDQVPESRMSVGPWVGVTADGSRCSRLPARRFECPARPRRRS